MRVRLGGTGGPEGWPVAGWGCASCGRLPPGHRRPLSIVVDDRLRLAPISGPLLPDDPGHGHRAGDPGPGDPHERGNPGQESPHDRGNLDEPGDLYPGNPNNPDEPGEPDDLGEPDDDGGLGDTAGPTRHEDGPGTPVAPDSAADTPHAVVATADGWVVTGPDGARLLHAFPSPVNAPEGPADAPEGEPAPPCDLVLIDVLDRPERLGDMRRRGVAHERTVLVVVGIDHRVPSEAELTRRLAMWGVSAVPDETVLEVRPGTVEKLQTRPIDDDDTSNAPTDAVSTPRVRTGSLELRTYGISGAQPAPQVRTGSVEAPGAGPNSPGRPRPRRTLLLGGSGSGKSAEAELRLAGLPEVVYVATGPSGEGDAEWRARVRAHRERRPRHWRTVETVDVAGLLRDGTVPLLVDGLGTWLAAVFDACDAWESAAGREGVARRCDELVDAWRQAACLVVAVSDEVGLGVVPASASGRRFRDALGRLNQRLAAESEEVALVVAGRPLPLPT